MRKIASILFFLTISCQSGHKEMVIQDFFSEAEIIDVSQMRTYEELIERLKTYECNSDHKILKLNDSFIPVHLGIYCLKGGNFADFKERNILQLGDNTEFTSDYIEEFILNNGRNPELSDSPNKVIIALTFSNNFSIDSIFSKMIQVNKVYQSIWRKHAKQSLLRVLSHYQKMN